MSGNGWQVKSLGEVLDFHYGKGLPKLFREEDGEFPVFGSNGIVGYHSKYFVEGPCLVIGRKGSAGEVQYSEKNCWPIDTTYYVKKSENYSLVFFYYLLRKLTLSQFDKSTAIPGLNRNDAYRIKIPLPPLPIQKQIAEILEKATQAKQKRKEANKLTEQFLQSAFIEMFGDPVKNPKGWDVKNVSDVCVSHDSKRIPLEGSVRENRNGIYPYYGASGIIDHIDDFIFDYDTILIAEDGANLISRSTPIAFIAKGKYWVNNHAHVLTPKSNMTFNFLTYFFNSTNLKPYITGSAQPKLTAKNLYNMQIPVPPLSLQQQFAELVQKTETLKEKQKASEKELENLFNSLMQKAFKGELEFSRD